MTMSFARLCAAASVFALAAGTAQAQDAATIQEIVVTAQKREEQSLEVPIALTAYSSERLEALGVEDFADLSLFTPGFEVQDQSPNNPGFVMRGITSDSTDATAEARVSVYQDGVSISKAQGSYVELFDLDRVEVAKGPQSTLYGRGALIGAVNIIQKKADPAGIEGYLKAEAGHLDHVLAEGALNAPLSDVLAVRFAARVRQRDGYVDNLLGGENFQSVDTFAGRVSVNFSPTDRLNADLIYNHQEDNPAGTAFKSGVFFPTSLRGSVLGDLNPSHGAALRAPVGFAGGRELGLERTVRSLTGLVSYELTDALTLNSISAWRKFDSKETFDPDGLSLAILTGLNDGVGEQWSQELRLNWDDGGRIRGFVGAGLFREEGDIRVPLQFDERMALAVVTGQLNGSALGLGLPSNVPAPEATFGVTPFTGALLQGLVAAQSGGRILLSSAQAQAIAANLRANHIEESTSSSELDSIDLFGDVSFDVTDAFEVSLGLRYTRDEKTTGFVSRTVGGRSVLGGALGAAQIAASGTPAAVAQAQAILGALALPTVQQLPDALLPNFGLTFQPTAGNGTQLATRDLESDGFTWRLVGRYALSDDANLYASYARGRRPEVLSVGGPAAPYGLPRFTEVPAETVDSFEIGGKAALFGRSVRVDGAIYMYNYENFQTTEQQGTLFVTTNAGKAKAYGFEGQAQWAAAPGLDLFATYAYSRARFESGARDGNRLRLSPDHTLSLAVDWRTDVLGGELAVRPSYSWQSKVFFDDNNDRAIFQQPPSVFVADNRQDELQDAYGLLNLRASWAPYGAPVSFEAFAMNITDEDYIIDAGNTGDSLGLPTFIAGAPRTYGVGVTWRFD